MHALHCLQAAQPVICQAQYQESEECSYGPRLLMLGDSYFEPLEGHVLTYREQEVTAVSMDPDVQQEYGPMGSSDRT